VLAKKSNGSLLYIHSMPSTSRSQYNQIIILIVLKLAVRGCP